MSSSVETERPKLPDFEALWSSIPDQESAVWMEHFPGVKGPRRKREVLELLCSVLWHLELASALGEFPRRTMLNYREQYVEGAQTIPWASWARCRKGTQASLQNDILAILLLFSHEPDNSFRYLLQSTLTADAALRLDATRKACKVVAHDPKSPLFANGLQISGWIDKSTLGFLPSTSPLQQQVTLIVAFRDSYMHSEVGDKGDAIRAFREKMLARYTLGDIFDACVSIWPELRGQLSLNDV
jgi:hypothetical protein